MIIILNKFIKSNLTNIFKFILILSLSINTLLANLYLPINTNKGSINLISSKDTHSHSEYKSKSGLITATIEDKGKITEVEIPAIIKVKDKFILNGKDITQKLDIKIVDEISQTLNSQNLKDSIIRELRSNSNTPLSQKEINQIKATLNSKEWNDKTTTLSGVGALVVTAVVTYFTAGAGSALASSLTAASATTASAVSAVTSAVITNASLQATNMVISNGKVKFDINSLTKSALSAGLGAYVNSYISGIDALNSNIVDTNYLKISYNDIANTLSNSAIQSGVYGISFKDALLANISTQTSNYLFKQAGNLGLVTNSKDGSLSKTLTHSIVGGSINAMQGDSFKEGAIIAGLTEALRPLSNNLGKDEQLLSSQLIGILSGAIIDSDKGANKGFNLATSSEVYNRQLHKDEEKFLNKHSKEFKSYYEKQTNKTISEDEAKSLLLLSSKHIVDAKDNAIFNILNFFGKTDFNKDEINIAKSFIYQNSQGLKFTDYYKENFTPTDFFSATDEQFYNHNYNPNTPQGLSDESFMFIPSAKVGVNGVKGVESTIFKGINISINNAYFNFKNGITKEIENIARTTAQKSYKGSTVAGHALDKHAGRKPEIWGTTSGGNNLRNKQAMKHFDDIMNGQGKFTTVTNDKGIQFLEKRLQDGRGIRLEMNGNFKGFID